MQKGHFLGRIAAARGETETLESHHVAEVKRALAVAGVGFVRGHAIVDLVGRWNQWQEFEYFAQGVGLIPFIREIEPRDVREPAAEALADELRFLGKLSSPTAAPLRAVT